MGVVAGNTGNFSLVVQRQYDPEISLGPEHSGGHLFRWFDEMVYVEGVISGFVIVTSQAEHFKITDKMDSIFSVFPRSQGSVLLVRLGFVAIEA